MAVRVYENEYKGWNKCVFITNGEVELVVTTAVGPRIIRYATRGGDNVLYEDVKALGTCGGDKFTLYGGHRLWHAPERQGRTYALDNDPVTEYEIIENGVRVLRREDENGIEKVMEITLAEKGSEVTVKHHVTNVGPWPIEAAAWGITMMRPNGYVAVPLVRHDESALLPDRSLTFWPYARYSDKRLSLGEDLITVEQDPTSQKKFKIGFFNDSSIIAYFENDMLFIKEHQSDDESYYPDFNSSFECYTDRTTIEVESLSPIYQLDSGETIEHVEKWWLYDGVEVPKAHEEEKVLAKIQEYYGK